MCHRLLTTKLRCKLKMLTKEDKIDKKCLGIKKVMGETIN